MSSKLYHIKDLLSVLPTKDLSDATKTDEFSEKFQTAFDPPSHFWKIILHFFLKKALLQALFKDPKSAL